MSALLALQDHLITTIPDRRPGRSHARWLRASSLDVLDSIRLRSSGLVRLAFDRLELACKLRALAAVGTVSRGRIRVRI